MRRYGPLVVVLYDINLTFDASEHFSKHVSIHINEQTEHEQNDADHWLSPSSSYASVLHSQMHRLVESWVDAGVNMVCAQKVIHPFLAQLCAARNIIVVERLSIRHVQAVHQIAGGSILSGIDPSLVQSSVLGRLSRLAERMIGRRRFVCMYPLDNDASSEGVCTLVLHAPSLAQQVELHSVTERIFKQLAWMVRGSGSGTGTGTGSDSLFVCAGAGATELALAEHIRRRVSERRRERQAKQSTLHLQIRTQLDTKADAITRMATKKSNSSQQQ